jgi:5'-phosphate synthase pdxT subunit
VLARVEGSSAVAARSNTVLVTAFHPELTEDSRVHQYFLRMASIQTTAHSQDQIRPL